MRFLVPLLVASTSLSSLMVGCGGAQVAVRKTAVVPPAAIEHYLRARLASEAGDHDDAVRELRLAIAASPDDAELAIAAGEELLAAGHVEDARSEADRAVLRWPREVRGWRLLGLARQRLGDLVGARTAFTRAAAADPDDAGSYLLLAEVDVKLGDEAGALAVYRDLVVHVPGSADGHLELGRALLANGEARAATPELERAVSLDPDDIDARVALADAYQQSNRAGDAQDTLREALDRSNNDPGVGERLVHVLLERGDRAAASAVLASLDDDHREPMTRLRLAYFFLQLHDATSALHIVGSVLAREPARWPAQILAARALLQLGRRDEALARCVAVPPDANEDYITARALAGDIVARAGAPQRGLELVNQGLAIYPDEPGLIVEEAALVEKLGDMAKARALLAAAGEHSPYDESVIYARASLEDRNGQPGLAIAIMQTLLDRDPKNVLALNFIGYSYADRGVELDTAERYLRRAAELKPDDGFVLDSLGWLSFRRGHLDDAAATIERADRLAPYEPEVLFHPRRGLSPARRGDPRARHLAASPDARSRRRHARPPGSDRAHPGSEKDAMIRLALLTLVTVTAVAGAACGGHPGRSDCEAIADKMIDIFTAPQVASDKVPAEVTASTNEWRKILKAKEKDPTRATLIDVCSTQMSSGAGSCVLEATDERSLAKCFGG